jgi:predicted glycoside hydrolase/deacetylase ChbG (UPF0249 family)
VFCADDLGVSAGCNAGIARAARAGTVGEASLCVTGEAVAEGAALAAELGIGTGLHLSFTLGRALTGALRGFTDGAGRFRGLGAVLRACLLRRVDRKQLLREVDAQLERLRQLVPEPTHINGHHHVHVFPVIRDVAFAAAVRHGMRWTRMPDELPAAGGRCSPARLLLSAMSRRAAPMARAAGLRWLPFVGITTENRTDFGARLTAIAARLPAGACEWMVHPREPDPVADRLDPRGRGRQAAALSELTALADRQLATLLAKQDVIVCRRFAEAGS